MVVVTDASGAWPDPTDSTCPTAGAKRCKALVPLDGIAALCPWLQVAQQQTPPKKYRALDASFVVALDANG